MEDTPKALRNMKIARRKRSIFYVQAGGVRSLADAFYKSTCSHRTGTSASYLSWSMPKYTLSQRRET